MGAVPCCRVFLWRLRFIFPLTFNVSEPHQRQGHFPASDSPNTTNFYSSRQVCFAGNKAAGDDLNCGVITVMLTRQDCFFCKESAPERDRKKRLDNGCAHLHVIEDLMIPFSGRNEGQRAAWRKKEASHRLPPYIKQPTPAPALGRREPGRQERFKGATRCSSLEAAPTLCTNTPSLS